MLQRASFLRLSEDVSSSQRNYSNSQTNGKSWQSSKSVGNSVLVGSATPPSPGFDRAGARRLSFPGFVQGGHRRRGRRGSLSQDGRFSTYGAGTPRGRGRQDVLRLLSGVPRGVARVPFGHLLGAPDGLAFLGRQRGGCGKRRGSERRFRGLREPTGWLRTSGPSLPSSRPRRLTRGAAGLRGADTPRPGAVARGALRLRREGGGFRQTGRDAPSPATEPAPPRPAPRPRCRRSRSPRRAVRPAPAASRPKGERAPPWTLTSDASLPRCPATARLPGPLPPARGVIVIGARGGGEAARAGTRHESVRPRRGRRRLQLRNA